MIDLQDSQPATVKKLAAYQGISETYLSKIFTKLTKANLVQSVPGIKGDYTLAKSPDEITFLNVFEAVEGDETFFKCKYMREPLAQDPNTDIDFCGPPCTIRMIMSGTEDALKSHLAKFT